MEQQESIFLNEYEEKEKKGSLNVLTILTFIGCGFAYLGGIWQFFTAQTNYEKLNDVISSGKMDQAPGFLKSIYSPEYLEQVHKMAENKLPLLIVALISASLCLFGAIQMRKLKADGYWLWLIGEVLPFAGLGFFVGAGALIGWSAYFYYAIVLVFVILYSVNKKYLTR